jgi:hypothetical protein
MENIQVLQAPDQQRDAGIGQSQRASETRGTRLADLLSSERGIFATVGLVFLPWIAVVFYTAGWWAALHLLAYAVMVFVIGYVIISIALPASARSQVILLSPALGILTISALTAFWVRLGLALIWAPALWLGLIAVGMIYLWSDRASWTRSTVPYGFALAVLSALACALCFYPAAKDDLVQRSDGSFSWKYVDTQQFYAIAESIKSSGSPPRTPGTVTVELLYHFGPYAPAAAISRLDGLDLGDALARVTRGAELWALVLSCFALGMLLSLKATGTKFGGIMSVAGLFFYGPLLLLIPFNGPRYVSGNLIGSVFLKTPFERMLPMGIPYDHLLSGHSVLHGLVAITAIMGLCLADKARESTLTWRGVTLLALPALAVPVNSLASMYCFGVVAILLFWGRLRETRPWLCIALMSCLFLVAWKIMGYSHSPDAHVLFKGHATAQWWMLLMWFLTVLGFRIVGFRWITRPLKEPLSFLVLASVLGWLAISLLLNMVDGGERYGMYFLQSIFSIFAFSRVPSGWWHRAERFQMIADWLRVAIKGMILFVACGFLIGVLGFATHTKTGISYFGPKLLLALLLLGLMAAASALMKRSIRFSRLGSGTLMVLLMAGFLAWSPDWVKYARGMVHTDVTYPSGEVHGLRRLGDLMIPGEVFATNKHDTDTKEHGHGRSNGYFALSGRPVLLEGYLNRGENMLPWFSDLLRDNDLLFTTTDPETLREIAGKWHVRYLVARPGTDIALPRPLPTWLVPMPDSGDLKIYRIDGLPGSNPAPDVRQGTTLGHP